MEDYEIWEAYINAQNLILEEAKRPIKIEKNSQTLNRGVLEAKVSIQDYEIEAKKLLDGAFPNVSIEEIDLDQGYIEKPTSLSFNESGLNKLLSEGLNNHLYFDDRAVVSGSVKISNDEALVNFLSNVNDNVALLTQQQINSINKQDENVKIKQIGCILRLKPKEDVFEKLRSFCIKNSIGNYQKFNIDERFFTVFNCSHIKKFEDSILTEFGFKLVNHTIAVKVDHFNINENEDFYYIDNHITDGVFLFLFRPYRATSPDDYKWGKDYLLNKCLFKRYFEKIFGSKNVKVQHASKFNLQEYFFTDLLEKKFQELDLNEFTINYNKRTIAFDLNSLEDFDSYYNQLMQIDNVIFDYKGKEHKFKVKLEYTSPLVTLKKNLEESFPSVRCKISRNNKSLSFGITYENEEDIIILRDRLIKFSQNNSKDFIWKLPEVDIETSKYYFDFKYKEIDKNEERRIRKHFGEGVMSEDKVIGVLQRSNYPFLKIVINDNVDKSELLNLLLIYGDLKGETDKITRLKDTIEKVFGNNPKKSCVNPNIAKILRLQ